LVLFERIAAAVQPAWSGKDVVGHLVAEIVAAVERTTYATDLRILQADVANLKRDVAELQTAGGAA
jgi:hypothetical protein